MITHIAVSFSFDSRLESSTERVSHNKQVNEVNIPTYSLHLFSLGLNLGNSSPTPSSYFAKNLLSVDHADGQLIGTLQNLGSLLGRNVVSNLSTVSVVVHHQKLQISNVAHDELVESVREHVLGGSVGTITDVRHDSGASEATSAASINTLGLSPVLLHKRLGIFFENYKKHTFILLNLSAWKRGKETVLFFTIFTLRIGAIAIYMISASWVLKRSRIITQCHFQSKQITHLLSRD